MFRERGGSSTFARYAFNELIAFIAGWAILIDYLIVIALAAISVPALPDADLERAAPAQAGRSASPRWSSSRPAGSTSSTSPGGGGGARSPLLALADVALQVAVIVVGVLAVWHPRPPHRGARPLHRPGLRRHRLRGGGRDARLRRDRGRLRPGAGHRRPSPRPEAGRLAGGDRGAAGLRRDGGDRADGGAGRRRPAGTRDGARRQVRRGSDPRGGLRLRPRLGRRHDALDGGADRRAGPLLGGEHVDARRLSPHLHAGDQPPDPELAGQARQTPRDALRGDHALRGRSRSAWSRRRTSSCWRASTRSARRWRSPSPISRSCDCGCARPSGRDRSAFPGGCPGAAPSCRSRRSSRRWSAASPSSACSPTTTPHAGSAAAGWPSGSSSTSSTARSSRGRR